LTWLRAEVERLAALTTKHDSYIKLWNASRSGSAMPSDADRASTSESEARIAEAVEMMRAALLDLTIAAKLKAIERLQGWVFIGGAHPRAWARGAAVEEELMDDEGDQKR
jgi:hypothetical protein